MPQWELIFFFNDKHWNLNVFSMVTNIKCLHTQSINHFKDTLHVWVPQALVVSVRRDVNWFLLDREHSKKIIMQTHAETWTGILHISYLLHSRNIYIPSGSCGWKQSWCLTVCDLLPKMTYLTLQEWTSRRACTQTHICSKKKKCTQSPHKVRKGTLEMFPFLKIESVMEAGAGNELCLCQRQRECDQVSGG